MEWFDSPAAQALLRRERALLSAQLPTLFGYHMLQLGDRFPVEAFEGSPIKHKITMSVEPRASSGLLGRPEQLPFERESLDLVLLPHILEFSATPHNILREVDRCLIPEGHVLIFGFNPWSHWQLIRAAMRWRHPVPWRGKYLSPRRLSDWLKLLGFEVLLSETFVFLPPFRDRPWMQRLDFIEPLGERLLPWMGGVYGLLARKRVETMTPLRSLVKTPRSVIGVGLSGSSRVSSRAIPHRKDR